MIIIKPIIYGIFCLSQIAQPNIDTFNYCNVVQLILIIIKVSETKIIPFINLDLLPFFKCCKYGCVFMKVLQFNEKLQNIMLKKMKENPQVPVL